MPRSSFRASFLTILIKVNAITEILSAEDAQEFLSTNERFARDASASGSENFEEESKRSFMDSGFLGDIWSFLGPGQIPDILQASLAPIEDYTTGNGFQFFDEPKNAHDEFENLLPQFLNEIMANNQPKTSTTTRSPTTVSSTTITSPTTSLTTTTSSDNKKTVLQPPDKSRGFGIFSRPKLSEIWAKLDSQVFKENVKENLSFQKEETKFSQKEIITTPEQQKPTTKKLSTSSPGTILSNKYHTTPGTYATPESEYTLKSTVDNNTTTSLPKSAKNIEPSYVISDESDSDVFQIAKLEYQPTSPLPFNESVFQEIFSNFDNFKAPSYVTLQPDSETTRRVYEVLKMRKLDTTKVAPTARSTTVTTTTSALQREKTSTNLLPPDLKSVLKIKRKYRKKFKQKIQDFKNITKTNQDINLLPASLPNQVLPSIVYKNFTTTSSKTSTSIISTTTTSSTTKTTLTTSVSPIKTTTAKTTTAKTTAAKTTTSTSLTTTKLPTTVLSTTTLPTSTQKSTLPITITSTTLATTAPHRYPLPSKSYIKSQVHSSIQVNSFSKVNESLTITLGCRKNYISSNKFLNTSSKVLATTRNDNSITSFLSKLSSFRCRYDECVFMKCLNNGFCANKFLNKTKLRLEYDHVISYCKCDGYRGKYCQYEIDECLLDKPVCEVHETCENTPGSYICHSPTTIGPITIAATTTALTTIDNSQRACLRYENTCNKLLELCTMSGGHVACKCRDNLTENCSRRSACDSSPCQNGKCITDFSASFICKCDHGFTGEYCETKLASYENLNSNPLINLLSSAKSDWLSEEIKLPGLNFFGKIYYTLRISDNGVVILFEDQTIDMEPEVFAFNEENFETLIFGVLWQDFDAHHKQSKVTFTQNDVTSFELLNDNCEIKGFEKSLTISWINMHLFPLVDRNEPDNLFTFRMIMGFNTYSDQKCVLYKYDNIGDENRRNVHQSKVGIFSPDQDNSYSYVTPSTNRIIVTNFDANSDKEERCLQWIETRKSKSFPSTSLECPCKLKISKLETVEEFEKLQMFEIPGLDQNCVKLQKIMNNETFSSLCCYNDQAKLIPNLGFSQGSSSFYTSELLPFYDCRANKHTQKLYRELRPVSHGHCYKEFSPDNHFNVDVTQMTIKNTQVFCDKDIFFQIGHPVVNKDQTYDERCLLLNRTTILPISFKQDKPIYKFTYPVENAYWT